MTTGGLALSFVAGVLSILSPACCRSLPIVLGAAASKAKWGPAALAAGLSLSFVAIGLFVATIGFSISLDADVFRAVAAVMIIAIGVVLMVPHLQTAFAVAGAPLAKWAHGRLEGRDTGGLGGQFAVGVLLGAVWSPCVGPTLGAASLLAAQGRDLGQVAAIMLVVRPRRGAAPAPPRHRLARGDDAVAREARRRRSRPQDGVRCDPGGDRRPGDHRSRQAVETALVDASPQWLTDLTTRF